MRTGRRMKVDAPSSRMPSSSDVLRAGERFAGGYEIQRILGEGASGVVYVATPIAQAASDRALVLGAGQHVALKVIHRHLVKDRQISRRFHREAAILGKLVCPQLVPLLDFGELDDGVLYMALELVDGRALDELMQGGPLDVARSVEICKQICLALDAAHGSGIVHRDLKPGNVIIESRPGEKERARVLDFGMAKVLRGDPLDSLNALTEQNMVFGTPEYMAPEQARGDEVDARSDIYAAGVILYEMLTGTVPFRASSPIGVMTAHLLEEPAAPSSRAPRDKISPALEAVVLHALAKSKADRYPSATALAEALDRALESPTDVVSTAPPPASRVTDPELALQDTEHALRISTAIRASMQAGALEPNVSKDDARDRHSRRIWLMVGIAAALFGIASGVAASLLAGD
jgi:eukaryotic-like serine/threonine-protein kinase